MANKVPCGGFILGDGLSLGEDGITVNVTGGNGGLRPYSAVTVSFTGKSWSEADSGKLVEGIQVDVNDDAMSKAIDGLIAGKYNYLILEDYQYMSKTFSIDNIWYDGQFYGNKLEPIFSWMNDAKVIYGLTVPHLYIEKRYQGNYLLVKQRQNLIHNGLKSKHTYKQKHMRRCHIG